jgi:hypothetical protein
MVYSCTGLKNSPQDESTPQNPTNHHQILQNYSHRLNTTWSVFALSLNISSERSRLHLKLPDLHQELRVYGKFLISNEVVQKYAKGSH